MAGWLAAIVAAAQVQAALVLLVGVIGWGAAGWVRRRELLRQRAGRLTAAAQMRAQGHQAPPVAVILPLRGCRPHSRDNWASQLAARYDGPLRFVFVVDSPQDPAVPVIKDLLAARQHSKAGGGTHQNGVAAAAAQSPPPSPSAARYGLRPRRGLAGGDSGGAPAVGRSSSPDALVVAGPATTCSQKIHNLLAGVDAALLASPPPAYLMFLDDDVALHPGTLGRLVDELEGDGAAFMATGYPFDLIPPGAPLAAYAVLVYHLPLSIAFTVRRRAPFVWGGCMLMRAEELSSDRAGVVRAWREGGYSDDLLAAAVCTRASLPVATHRAALLPQLLPPSIGWRSYWNYLRRQLYVLDTYHDEHCRSLNHTMMAIHSWASLAVAASLLSAAAQVACRATPLLAAAAQAAAAALQPHWGGAPAVGSAVGKAAAAAHSRVCPAEAGLWWQDAALWLFVASVALAQASLSWMASQSMQLMGALSREGEPGAAAGKKVTAAAEAAAPRRGSAAVLAKAAPISWPRVWAGLLVESLLLPPCVVYTLLVDTIDWAGITYRKHKGRVKVVARQ